MPRWAPKPAADLETHIARKESVAIRRAYATPFRRQRCLVPASGWYAFDKFAQPHYILPTQGGTVCFAGIWDQWRDRAVDFDSFSIIIGGANSHIAHIDRRSPVIMEPNEYLAWLDPAQQDVDALQKVLTYCDAERKGSWYEIRRVSDRIMDVNANDESLVENIDNPDLTPEVRHLFALDHTTEELNGAFESVQVVPYWREILRKWSPRELLRVARHMEQALKRKNRER